MGKKERVDGCKGGQAGGRRQRPSQRERECARLGVAVRGGWCVTVHPLEQPCCCQMLVDQSLRVQSGHN